MNTYNAARKPDNGNNNDYGCDEDGNHNDNDANDSVCSCRGYFAPVNSDSN